MKTPAFPYLLSPGVRLMNRLRYPGKFLLITCLLALPTLVLVVAFCLEINSTIHIAGMERLGNAYLRPLLRLLEDVQMHRGLSCALHSGKTFISEDMLALKRADVERDLKVMSEANARWAGRLGMGSAWPPLERDCRQLLDQNQQITASASFERHGAVISGLLDQIVEVADKSGLVLDPYLDSYYLMNSIVQVLPEVTEQLGQGRGWGAMMAEGAIIHSYDRFFLGSLSGQIASRHGKLRHNYEVACSYNPGLSVSLEEPLRTTLVALSGARVVIDELAAETSRQVPFDPKPVFSAVSYGIKSSVRLAILSANALDDLLLARMDNARGQRRGVLAVSAISMFVVLYLLAAFYLSVRRTVSGLEDAARRLVGGEMQNVPLRIDARDELGRVVTAFGEIADRLRAEWAQSRAEAVRATEAESRAKESEEITRLVVDTALDAVVGTDAVGTITRWNHRAEVIFGWTNDEALGRSLAETIIPPEFREAHAAGLARFLETGAGPVLGKRIEVQALRRNGERFPAELTISPLRLGSTHVFSAFIEDITDRKRAEHDLVQARDHAEAASRAKSEFLATMSHEIRTPMNGVLGFTDLLLETALNPDQRQHATVIKESADGLLSILNDILDFSKIEAGKLQVESLPFSLRQVVDQVLRLLAAKAAERQLQLVVDLDPSGSDEVQADPVRVRQVLINLLGNALKFTKAGCVTLRVRHAPAPVPPTQPSGQSPLPDPVDTLLVQVIDTGIGIPADKQSALFQMFSQADSSTTRKFGGTGLGLAICRRLVEMMGGSIGLQSEPGRGSTFWFTLPLAGPMPQRESTADHAPSSANATLTPAPQERRGPPGACRVLLVDDMPLNQLLAQRLLLSAACEVIAASSGTEAVELAEREAFDLILMDCQIPGLDGFEATREIRRREQAGSRRRIPIIAVTAGVIQENRDQCEAAGMDDFLSKPYRVEELSRLVAKWRSVGRTLAP